MPHRLASFALRLLASTLCVSLLVLPLLVASGHLATAHAMKIQEVKSPGGIEAWLVEEHSVPIIAMHFAFKGGSAQDAPGKEGTANFVTAMLDEGAGEFKHERFHEMMEELAIKMRFDAGKDSFSGSFETLTVNRDAGFDLLRLALNKPRFDADAIERMRTQLTASLAFGEKDPGKVAGLAWTKAAFGTHTYGRPTEGTKESLAAIQKTDLEGYRSRVFARDTLKISVVGDIDARTLGVLLDKLFGALAAKADIVPVAAFQLAPEAKKTVIEMKVPQSVAIFGHGGPLRKDPDFIGAFMLNYILGGGGFNSRLMEQVREKRGLAYSVSSYLSPYDRSGLMLGNVATKNEAIDESMDVIKAEFKRMADEGPTENELIDAKSYLTGSYPLRFDTSPKIASQLLGIQIEDLGIDYIDKRNGQIEAVSLADIRAIAKRLLKPDNLIVTIVGQPTPKVVEPKATAPAAAKGGKG
jgi:zinc protease